MTALVPATKFMAHLPLLLHTGKPESALIICFGMGTSFRSALSWNIDTTAVELVPGVRDSFGFFHADADLVRHNPQAHIIIDDGRRYLERTREQYDVIVVDPPPPVSSAGSSLLYSEEFYRAAKRNLKPYGILHAWLPATDLPTEQAVVRSVANSFPHVQCFRSPADVGIHILASMEPINFFGAESLAYGMPMTAGTDLLEWSSGLTLPQYIAFIMSRPVQIDELLNPNPNVRITDDRPFNEYFLLRRLGLF
jgi:spermidine synthase